jgi:hypothetical protein
MRSLGTIFFTIGLLLLMNNLGWFDEITWSVVGPVIFIVVGIWFVLRGGKSCTCSSLCKIGGICHGKCVPCHGEVSVKETVSKTNGSKK